MLSTLMLAAILTQAPAAKGEAAEPDGAKASSHPDRSQEQVRAAIELRRVRRAERARATIARRQRARKEAEARWRETEARMREAHLRQREQLEWQLQAQQVMEAQQRMALAREESKLASQRAGVPQMYVRGQGMVPVPGGTAIPDAFKIVKIIP